MFLLHFLHFLHFSFFYFLCFSIFFNLSFFSFFLFFSFSFSFFFFFFQSSKQTTKPSKKSSRSSYHVKTRFPFLKIRFLGLGGQGGSRTVDLRVTSLSCFSFFFLFFFFFFFCVYLEKSFFFHVFSRFFATSSICIRVQLLKFPPKSVLRGDVVSCRNRAGKLGLGWATGPPTGREHDSPPQSGVEAPRLLKRSLSRLYFCCSFIRKLSLRAAQGVVFARVPPTTLVLETPHTQNPILDQSRSHLPCQSRSEHASETETTQVKLRFFSVHYRYRVTWSRDSRRLRYPSPSPRALTPVSA